MAKTIEDFKNEWDYKWNEKEIKEPKLTHELKDTSFVKIQSFMITKYGLKGNSLLIFALIHGFTMGENKKMTASNNYIASWTNSSVVGIRKSIKQLLEMGLIVKSKEPDKHGVFSYRSMCKPDGEVLRLKKDASGNFVTGGEQQSYRGDGNKVTGQGKLCYPNILIYSSSYYNLKASKTSSTLFSAEKNRTPQAKMFERAKAKYKAKNETKLEEREVQNQTSLRSGQKQKPAPMGKTVVGEDEKPTITLEIIEEPYDHEQAQNDYLYEIKRERRIAEQQQAFKEKVLKYKRKGYNVTISYVGVEEELPF